MEYPGKYNKNENIHRPCQFNCNLFTGCSAYLPVPPPARNRAVQPVAPATCCCLESTGTGRNRRAKSSSNKVTREQYTVKKGDTLWDISSMFLRDPWYWPEIWHKNQQVKNPHLIYPGDILTLIYVDGQPQIMVKKPTHATSADGPICAWSNSARRFVVKDWMPVLQPYPAMQFDSSSPNHAWSPKMS